MFACMFASVSNSVYRSSSFSGGPSRCWPSWMCRCSNGVASDDESEADVEMEDSVDDEEQDGFDVMGGGGLWVLVVGECEAPRRRLRSKGMVVVQALRPQPERWCPSSTRAQDSTSGRVRRRRPSRAPDRVQNLFSFDRCSVRAVIRPVFCATTSPTPARQRQDHAGVPAYPGVSASAFRQGP